MPELIEVQEGQQSKVEQDLSKYLKFNDSENIKESERRELRKNLEQWDQTGDVEKIRTAGVSQEDNRDNYLKRHQLLSAEFLKKNENSKDLKLKIDFKNNELAEWRVGLADLLPPNVKRVRLRRADGSVAVGVRAQNPETKRFGYYEETDLKSGKFTYLACHTGDSCEPIETYTVKNEELGDTNTYREHIEIFTNDAAKESSSDPYETDNYTAKNREQTTPEQVRTDAQKERQQIQQEVAPTSTEAEQTIRKKIVEAAQKRVDIVDANFRTNDVAGGKLACAKVITTILKEAGFVDRINLNVDGTMADLKRKGWTESTEKAEPGDVVIWDAFPGRKHKHIGIAINETEAVNNSSAKRMPVIGKIYGRRSVLAILKPPIPKAPSTPARPSSLPGGTQPTETAPRSTKPSGIEWDTTPRSKRHLPEGYQHTLMTPKTPGKLEKFRNDINHNLPLLKILPEWRGQLNNFKNKYEANKHRYLAVANKCNFPAELIAVIHYMESGVDKNGNPRFDTYLHNGDPLRDKNGKPIPTKNVPKGKLFYDWESAAIDAIQGRGKAKQKHLGLSANSNDLAAMAAFAESFNGAGYHYASKNIPSPYLYSGTNLYQKGKYVADGKWNPNAVSKQLGVIPMLMILGIPAT